MSYKKFLGAASAALMIVIVVTLALAPAAGAASEYKMLYRFHGVNGATPTANLILDAAGNLYGTTSEGGAADSGTVFKLAPNQDGSWTESVLHSFNRSHKTRSIAGLIFDAVGNLYGTTIWGGTFGHGTVFKLAPNQDGSWTESVLHSFNRNDGGVPDAGLTFDAAGNLYGTTIWGGASGYYGTIFKLAPNQDGSWTESVLHSFIGSDGDDSYGGLIFDAAGNLYGTTYGGGAFGYGTVFKLAPNQDGSWTESVLHSFKRSDGRYPDAALIVDAAGNLYGTTSEGGHLLLCGGSGCGVVFKLTPNHDGSWTESVLHRFAGTGAASAIASLIFDAAGNLYRTAAGGGSANGGAAFKLSPNLDGSWAYRLVHAFQRKPARIPTGGLVLGSAGALYGTTEACSRGCKGVVYQITP